MGYKNASYYLNYFQRAEERGYPPTSWNWPIFFVGWLWLLYRRLYLWAAVYFFYPYAVWMLAALARPLLGDSLATTMVVLAVVGFQFFYMPFKANGIYYQHARRRIEIAKKQFPGQEQKQLALLEEQGGVNPNAPFVALSLIFLLMTLLGQFAPPGE